MDSLETTTIDLKMFIFLMYSMPVDATCLQSWFSNISSMTRKLIIIGH